MKIIKGTVSGVSRLARLEEKLGPENIYRTDEQETKEFITDGERVWVRAEK